MPRYHAAIGFPRAFRRPVGVMHLLSSPHARARAEKKGFDLPKKINLQTAAIFEIEMAGPVVTKIVARIPYDSKRDMSLAIAPGKINRIRSAWLNSKSDKHPNLNTALYDNPEGK